MSFSGGLLHIWKNILFFCKKKEKKKGIMNLKSVCSNKIACLLTSKLQEWNSENNSLKYIII